MSRLWSISLPIEEIFTAPSEVLGLMEPTDHYFLYGRGLENLKPGRQLHDFFSSASGNPAFNLWVDQRSRWALGMERLTRLPFPCQELEADEVLQLYRRHHCVVSLM